MATTLPTKLWGHLIPETNSNLLASEATTLKYLRANSAIPVPKVFAYRSLFYLYYILLS